MFCSKCGSSIPENSKFCTECGMPVQKASELTGFTREMKCNTCGGTLEIHDDKQVLLCPFCGSKEIIFESDAVKIQKIKSETYKHIEAEKRDVDHRRIEIDKGRIEVDRKILELELEREKAKRREYREAQNAMHYDEDREAAASFIHGKLSKAIVVLFVLFFLGIFIEDTFLPRFIAIVQCFLCVLAWLLGARVIKVRIPGLPVACFALAIFLFFPYVSIGDSDSEQKRELERQEYLNKRNSETYDWPTTGLFSMLPKPESQYGSISYNSDDRSYMSVYQINHNQFIKYKNDCISIGFDNPTTDTNDIYRAYNDEYYKIDIMFSSSGDEMTIFIEAPRKYSKYKWPSSNPAQSLPQIDGKDGYISTDSSDSFCIYIADISVEDFNDYINECMKAGYDRDYSRGDDYYYAKNSRGYKVTLSREYDGSMYIYADTSPMF